MEQMIIERNVAIPSDDVTLRADVFRPKGSKPAPVIMTLGPYGKGIHWKTSHTTSWEWINKAHPDLLPSSTKSLLTWETVDPEIWVPWGYAVIRVDSRGSGKSPGYLDIQSPREIADFYNAIEWAGTQTWSSGNVGLCGISYYAINQWQVASLQPPHLTAMIPWEGAADFYRDFSRHGGIFSNVFLQGWYSRTVATVQNGNPATVKDAWVNDSASGADVTPFDEETLRNNRRDMIQAVLDHPLDDEFHQQRSTDWSKVTVPFLSAASWAGFGLHPRGNFEGFMQAASKHKWLECHPGRHEEWFYLEQGIQTQKKFLDCFLKGENNGWMDEPPVQLRVRRPFSDVFDLRKEHSWPLKSTKWTNLFISTEKGAPVLTWGEPKDASSSSFDALGEPLTLLSAPLDSETEITGPMAAKIFASSTTTDMDFFVTLLAFSPEWKEVEFEGTVDPHTPLAQGWLRASHRKLDKSKTLAYRPYHSHDELLPVEPNQVYELDIEVWPTHIILPAGFRLALQIGGKDFAREPTEASEGPFRGSGPFLHTHPEDRPAAIFGGRTTIYAGGETPSRLLVPIIPSA